MIAKQTELERMLEDKDDEILELMQEVDRFQQEKSSRVELNPCVFVEPVVEQPFAP